MMIFKPVVKSVMVAALSLSSVWAEATAAQSALDKETRTAPAAASDPGGKPRAYLPVKVPKHAKNYYQLYGGVDNLRVQRTASGNLIRFSYRVTDAARAKALGEKNATPYMFGPRSKALLQIPVMDKIGQLRQTGTPVAGQEYWMVFSNKGNLIKAGDRVNVMVGSFHIDGLLVE